MSLRALHWSSLGLCLCVAACSDGDSFAVVEPTSTALAVRSDTPLAVSGSSLAFLADEATTGSGTDLNGDGDQVDTVAVAVDIPAESEVVLGVATRQVAWISNELFLVVSEQADGKNWEPVDTGPAIVLLHWSASAGTVTYVDNVSSQAGRAPILGVGPLLFYASALEPTAAYETNLRAISARRPTTPFAVASSDAGGPLSARLLGEEDGLAFVQLNEAQAVRDLNGDGDQLDDVLALLDATGTIDGQGYVEEVLSTRLAFSTSASRRRASAFGPHDWCVAFLVSEASQGDTNLNDPDLFPPEWRPPQCVTAGDPGDTDTLDQILCVIAFAPWSMDPVANPPINTGLAGNTSIAMGTNAVATIAADGSDGTCDLNADGDLDDQVVRWVDFNIPLDPPLPPPNTPDLLLALDDVPGGIHGLTELTGRFVIVVDEASDSRDHDGDGLLTHDLLAWIDPQIPAIWEFDHDTSAGVSAVGTSWLTTCKPDSRLGVGLEEQISGLSINSPGIGGSDVDDLDSMASFAQFSADGSTLVFPRGVVALDSDNGGLVIGAGIGFFRASEAEDSRDWNGDGDLSDFVLLRSSLGGPAATKAVSTLNPMATPAISIGHDPAPAGAAFIADESAEGPAGTDFNGDGDTTDLVVRYFRF